MTVDSSLGAPAPACQAPLLSVVVPMKNEEASVDAFLQAVVPVLRHVAGERFEIVAVNDGSADRTLETLLGWRERLPQLRLIDLSRNFGKEAALTAGLQHARGEAVIPMDVDLQDPPELIPTMVERWREGFEVVNARRVLRSGDTPMKRLTAAGFYALMHRLSEVPIPVNVGDFRLMDAAVVRALLTLPERTRFNKGIFAWVGFRQTVLDYERPGRREGGSAWTARSLWRLAIDGITCFSSLPLRACSLLGVLMGLGAFTYAAFVIASTLWFGRDVPGYASLIVVMLVCSALIMMSIGVLGEYLARVFVEVKGRPLYIIRRTWPPQDGAA
jgi:glycosyltransferase involved in cell wall biosynthesis